MRDLLKFMTCGAVDDGKSTLIGRMLYDAHVLFADQKRALRLESKSYNNNNKEINYSLLLDGLMAEREQGITIDIAYRYFKTNKRAFIVADCPGHEQYTGNMAVGASNSDLAVVLIDATKGISIQTKRHLRICLLFGINNIIMAINKMDLINYNEYKYHFLANEILEIVNKINNSAIIHLIPICATKGENITFKSSNMLWYKGKSLLSYLEEVDVYREKKTINEFIMPIQRVCKDVYGFRGYQGQIEAGNIKLKDEVTILPEYNTAKIARIYVTNRKANIANRGQAVTIQIDRELDISRGSVLTRSPNIFVKDLFIATILWFGNDTLNEDDNYIIKCFTRKLTAQIIEIKCKFDITTWNMILTKKVRKNEIAECKLLLSEKIPLDIFKNNPSMGSFILIDKITNATVGCGVVKDNDL